MNVKKKHGCKKGAIREELNPLARLTPPLLVSCSLRGLLIRFSFPNLSPLFSHRYFSVTGACLGRGMVVFGVVPGRDALVSPGADYQKWRPLFSPSTHPPSSNAVVNNSLDQYFITILFPGENSSCLRFLVLCSSHLASKNRSTDIWQQ